MEVLEKLRFKKVSRFMTRNYKADTNRTIINRAHNGFVFCLEGKMIFSENGKEYICDKNHVILASKGCDYEIKVIENVLIFILDFELFDGKFKGIHCFEIQESNSFYHDFMKMQAQLSNVGSHELLNLSMLYEITAHINGYGLNDKKYKMIEPSEKYLFDNLCNKDLSINEIARQSELSEAYFRRLFKEKYGISPMQYINENRLKKAKEMLIENEMNISDISTECGFLDIYSFSRFFKKSAGISPSEYKKNMKYRNC